MRLEKQLDDLWWRHTVPGDNEWDNWRRYGRAVLSAERDALLRLCALDGMTLSDIARIIEERNQQ